MQRSTRVAVAFAVGAAALLAPISLSVYLAWRQSQANERARVLSYARDVLRRSEETRAQTYRAIDTLKAANYPACSAQEIKLMQQLDITSSYIQALGRTNGDKLICTSLGTTQAMDLGPVDVMSENGVGIRTHVPAALTRTYPLTVLSKDGYVCFVDPSLVVDTPTEGPDIKIAVFIASDPKRYLVAARDGNFRSNWFAPVAKGGAESFIDGGYVVSTVRSVTADVAVVVAAPQLYVARRVREFALIFVPIGLLCGAGLAWAVMYISRIQISMPAMLRTAAKRREFYVEYQPIVELGTGRWRGAEALVRWKHGGKTVRPDEFIPVAEESGVITLITQQVLKMVAEELPKLTKLDPQFQVAINLSAQDMKGSTTLEIIERMLELPGIAARNLEMEATESGFLQGEEAVELIAQVRARGISVAIDDFGTGYSSLARVQTLGLDTLKIDKTFVDTIGTDGATSQVVHHIIEMAHSLKLEMVAEGVETEAQAEFLRARGVRYAQGWLFGRPMAAETLRKGLVEQEARREVTA